MNKPTQSPLKKQLVESYKALSTETLAGLLADATIESGKGEWSARCDCRNDHNSNSGRCNARDVVDPTAKQGGAVYCEDCRRDCKDGGRGKASSDAGPVTGEVPPSGGTSTGINARAYRITTRTPHPAEKDERWCKICDDHAALVIVTDTPAKRVKQPLCMDHARDLLGELTATVAALTRNDDRPSETITRPGMRRVHWTFDDQVIYEGWTDDTYWNGWLNVWVTPEVHKAVIADVQGVDGDDESVASFIEMTPVPTLTDDGKPDPRKGLISYAYAYCASEVPTAAPAENIRCASWHVVRGEEGDVRLILSNVDGSGAFISLSKDAAVQLARTLCTKAVQS